MSTAGLQKPKKMVPDRKTHRKSCPEAAQNRPSAQHGRARLREATKTQQNVTTERRAPRKHKKDVKQKRERKPPMTTNADVPLVILPTRVRSKFAKKVKTSSMEALTFPPCSKQSGLAPNAQQYVHGPPLQMGGLPLILYIYIYLHIYTEFAYGT